ncbi:MAG TPA: Holliday junction branch migration protein RuvA [Acidimicrobiales bacterium]|nr:Holliday junction branch migration protein RuvA [Acidimicrobiales bacterium]
MIGSVRGVLLDRAPRGDHAAEVIVEAAGVGYRVVVPAGAIGRLGELGGPVFLHVHTHVRDDAIVLFGFPERDERMCFEVLIAAHGVGPAVALAMLSVHSPAALRKAVATDDVDALTLVPGVGRKTAARMLVELKDRLGADDDSADLAVVADGGPGAGADPRAEVRAALTGLGYGADEVRWAVAHLPAEGTVEVLLRRALRDLAAAR